MLETEASVVTGVRDFGSNLTENLVVEGYVLRALVKHSVDGFLGCLSGPVALESKNQDIGYPPQFATAERKLTRFSVKSELCNFVNSIRDQEVVNRCHKAAYLLLPGNR